MLARGTPKTPFLNFFYARCRPPHPRLAPYTPEVETPAPAHPDGLHITGSSADPRKARHTRPNAGHAAPVCTRYQADRAGQIVPAAGAGCGGTCPKLCRFGRNAAAQKNISFVNTFVARATQNPFTVSQKCDIIMSQD